MKSIRYISYKMKLLFITMLIGIPISQNAYSFSVDPGVIGRQISTQVNQANQLNNSQPQDPLIIYQGKPRQQGQIIIENNNRSSNNK